MLGTQDREDARQAQGNRAVLLVGATASSPGDTTATDLVEQVLRPAASRYGGSVLGAYDDHLVAAFPDTVAADRAAEELQGTSAWALPDVTITTETSEDRPGPLPSTQAIVGSSKRLGAKLAGAVVPVGGAGVGAIVLWQPETDIAASAVEMPLVTESPAQPAVETAVDDGAAASVADATPEPALEPDLDMDGVLIFVEDESHLDIAIDALTRFDDAGLDVPDGLQIYFHGEDAPECSGHTNRAFATHGLEYPRIDMCRPHDFTLRHEIAHSWAYDHLDDGTVEEFLGARGLEDWQGNTEWALNGSEHAAHIIAWGLGDRAIPLSEIPDAYDMGELGDAFEILTGERPLHDPGRATEFSAVELVSSEPVTAPDTEPLPISEPVEPLASTADLFEPLDVAPAETAFAADDWHEVDDADDDDLDDDFDVTPA